MESRLSISRGSVAVLLSGVLDTTRVGAQGEVDALRGRRFEFRPYVGAYVPTGDQRDLLEDAVLVGAQASWRIVPQIALTEP